MCITRIFVSGDCIRLQKCLFGGKNRVNTFDSATGIIRCVCSNEGTKRVRNFRRCIRLSGMPACRGHTLFMRNPVARGGENRERRRPESCGGKRGLGFSLVSRQLPLESRAHRTLGLGCAKSIQPPLLRGFTTFRRRSTLSPELKSTSGARPIARDITLPPDVNYTT